MSEIQMRQQQLNSEIKELNIQLEHIKNTKPTQNIYQKKSNIYFLSNNQQVVDDIKDDINNKNKILDNLKKNNSSSSSVKKETTTTNKFKPNIPNKQKK